MKYRYSESILRYDPISKAPPTRGITCCAFNYISFLALNAAHESHGLIAKNHTYTNEGRAIIERATAAMVDLFTLSKSMSRYMNETDGLMQGNGEAIRQVESTIASIDKSIQDMAAGTQQASANSHDLENEVRRLYGVVQGLSRITTISDEDVHTS